jgi:hypothetical protein
MRIMPLLIISAAVSFLLVQPSLGAEKEKQRASEQEFCRLDKNNDREITFEEFSAC